MWWWWTFPSPTVTSGVDPDRGGVGALKGSGENIFLNIKLLGGPQKFLQLFPSSPWNIKISIFCKKHSKWRKQFSGELTDLVVVLVVTWNLWESFFYLRFLFCFLFRVPHFPPHWGPMGGIQYLYKIDIFFYRSLSFFPRFTKHNNIFDWMPVQCVGGFSILPLNC